MTLLLCDGDCPARPRKQKLASKSLAIGNLDDFEDIASPHRERKQFFGLGLQYNITRNQAPADAAQQDFAGSACYPF
jgi:hypothetical protein